MLWRHLLLVLSLSGLRVKNEQVGAEDQLSVSTLEGGTVGRRVFCVRDYTLFLTKEKFFLLISVTYQIYRDLYLDDPA